MEAVNAMDIPKKSQDNRIVPKGPETNGDITSDSVDNDQEDDKLVIDLDDVPDDAQKSTKDKKMDNVFDRILSNVTFNKESPSTNVLNDKEKPATPLSSEDKQVEIKKEPIDENFKGLKNLGSCLRGFEGRLKQSGGLKETGNSQKENTIDLTLEEENPNSVEKVDKDKPDPTCAKIQTKQSANDLEHKSSDENLKDGNEKKTEDNIDSLSPNQSDNVEIINGNKKDTDNCNDTSKSKMPDMKTCENKAVEESGSLNPSTEKNYKIEKVSTEHLSRDKNSAGDLIVIDKSKELDKKANAEDKDHTSTTVKNVMNNESGISTSEKKDFKAADGTKVAYRFKGKCQDKEHTICQKCEKNNCTCSAELSSKNSEAQLNDTANKSSSIKTKTVEQTNLSKKQQQTSAAWSKLGVQRCENCKFTTDDASLFDSHNVICTRKDMKEAKVSIKLKYSENKFICYDCDYNTVVRKKFEEHVALHLMAQPYICITCNITFDSKKDIELHVRSCHAKETVKCGLKGSKRIGQIIDSLIKTSSHIFPGRSIGKRVASKESAQVSELQKVPKTTASSLVNSSASSLNKDSDVIFVSSSSVMPKNTPSSLAEQKVPKVLKPSKNTTSALPEQKDTNMVMPTLPQTVTSSVPLILVPVNNVSGGLYFPLHSVPAQSVASSMNTTVATSTAPLRYTAQNITIQGNTIRTNPIQQGVSSNIVPGQMSGAIGVHNGPPRFVIIPPGNIPPIVQQTIPVSIQSQNHVKKPTLVPVNSMMGVTSSSHQQQNLVVKKPSLVPVNPTTGNQRTLVSTVYPISIRPTLAQAQAGNGFTLLSTSMNNTPVSTTVASTTSSSGLKDIACPESDKSVDQSHKKLYFRKSGELYMCDFCNSETPLEDSFKEHIWKHFHQMQNICKECPTPYNKTMTCKIVLKVMMGLLNSALDAQQKKTEKHNVGEVVTISDDEDAEKVTDGGGKEVKGDEKMSVQPANDVETTLNKDEEDGFQLKITSTFSLQDPGKNEVKTTDNQSEKIQDIVESPKTNTNESTVLEISKGPEEGSKNETEKDNSVKTELDIPKSEKDLEKRELKGQEKEVVETGLQSDLCQDKEVENAHLAKQTTDQKNETLNNEVNEKNQNANNVNNEPNTNSIPHSAVKINNLNNETNSISTVDRATIVDNLNTKANDVSTLDNMLEPVTSQSDSVQSVNSDKIPQENPMLNNIDIPNVDETATTEIEIDKKPIAFPLVAFYKCGFDSCSFSASTSQEFRDHLALNHGETSEYKCAHCGQKSFTEDSHIRHLLFHSKPQNSCLFQCGIIGCRFRANLLHIYKEHLEHAHDNVLTYKCHSCKEGFSSISLLIEHLQNNLLKFVQCPFCSMKDGVRRNVLNHITTHHPGKPRQINVTSQLICQERETNEFEKNLPKAVVDEIASKDTQISSETPIESRMDKTLENNRMNGSNDVDTIRNDPEDEAMINKITSNNSIMGATYYRCNSCTYLGIGHTKLGKHKEMHKPGFTQQVQRTFVCPECPQSVNILPQFISHLNLHVGEHLCHVYICQHCGFGTNLSNKIQQHVFDSHESNIFNKDYTERTIRFSVKVIYCTKCSAAFKTSQAHRDHVLKTHGITTDEISGKDDLNSRKTTANKQQVDTNIISSRNATISPTNEKEQDSNKRRFTCNECGWATRQLTFLKHHVKRHFPSQDSCQITLFKCTYCEFSSTSKLIISGHSQNEHPGKLLRVRRIVETVHIAESPEDDLSIDKFHCDLCTFSCEKISTLQSHLEDSHSGKKKLDEMNKPKEHYTGPKQEFLIPSGTVFKDVIQCSMCTFRTKKRIELLRHIKIHPSLEPKTESADSQPSEKVQNPLFESYYKHGMKRKLSSEGNPATKKSCPSSSTIPYDRLLMDTAKRDTGYRKQVATKSTTNRGNRDWKSMLYFLGGDQLHMKLKPCISEFKDSLSYYCLICNDVFDEKYKLHKHILQHMKVYFYKCAYCDHGTLDQTQVMVHIQRTHRRSIQYSKLDVEEIDSHINKAIHDMKSQVNSGKEKIQFEEMPKDTKSELLQKDAEAENRLRENSKLVGDSQGNVSPTVAKEKVLTKLMKADIVLKEKTPPHKLLQPGIIQKEKISPQRVKKELIKEEKISPPKPFKKEITFKHWGGTESIPKEQESSVQNSELESMFTLSEVTGLFNDRENEDVQSIANEKESMNSLIDKTDLETKSEVDLLLHPRLNKVGEVIECTVCRETFTARGNANKHMLFHTEVKRFMCSVCLFNYVSRWRGDMKKHIETKHARDETAECLWDDVTPCDLTNDGVPYNEYKYNNNKTPPKLLSEFKKMKEEAPGIKSEFESDISDIKLNTPTKRPPFKIKLSVGKNATRDEVNGADYLQSIFKCLVCSKTFKSRNAINQHFRSFCKDNLYGCPNCTFKDTDEKKVEQHLIKNHGLDKSSIATLSRNHKIRIYRTPRSKKDKTKEISKNSDKENTKSSAGSLFRCMACKRTFKTKNAGLYHAISAICNKTLKKCSECDFKDVSMQIVESHIKKTHKEGDIKAIELSKESKIEMLSAPTSKLNLNKDGNITFFTRDNGEYKCRLCDFKCQTKSGVIEHQVMHNTKPAYGCPYCTIMTSNYIKSVRSHIKKHHHGKVVKVKSLSNWSGKSNDSSDKQSLINKTDNSTNSCVMHKCLQCNFRAGSYSAVFKHIKRTEACNMPRFKCKECSKFSSLIESEVIDHIRTIHNSKELPEICTIKEMTKMVIVKKKLKADGETNDVTKSEKSRIIEKFSKMEDSDTKVITCPVTGCSFKDKVIKVVEHYRKSHPTKVMKCKMCHLTSKSLGIMFMHFKEFHKLEDHFSTSFLICPKRRDGKENNLNEQSSEPEITSSDKGAILKSYDCDRCAYTASNKNVLRRHLYRHMNYKKVRCPLCKAEFLDRKNAENHLTAIHMTNSIEFDEIKNERIEKEVEELLEKCAVWQLKEESSKELDVQEEETNQKKKSPTLVSKTAPPKNKKGKGGKKSSENEKNTETTLKLKVDYTLMSADMFNQSNYIKEVMNRKTKEMEYLCLKCPYKSIAKHCALGHTYKHMPKCMKCPFCNFQGYPRTDVTKHVKSTHPEKQPHVIDLRYPATKSESSAAKKRKTTFLDFDAEIFTSEGSSDEDSVVDTKSKRTVRRKTATRSNAEDKNRKTKYVCNLCEYETEVLYLYRQHLTFHDGFKYQIQGTTLESKNKCGYCGYISTSNKEFDSHMEKHLNSRPFNCPYCSFSQYTQASVRYHVQNSHPTRKVHVLKDSSSSFLTGDGKVPKVMLVDLEPKIQLRDIFLMESESFEDLLITANVSVIDLHSIPDDQFGNVSKLLGVNGEETDDDSEVNAKTKKPKKRTIEETTEDSDVDEVDGSCNIDERNYSDISDDETRIADDESRVGQDDFSDQEAMSTSTHSTEEKKEKVEKDIKSTKRTEYEDISDAEMEDSGAVININNEKFIVKSDLTYEDISDDDSL